MEYVIADTYCKAGGAGMGYHMAGFKVVGIDIEPQPNYPFEFIQCDAIEFINKHRKDFDAWHASPPCQKFTTLSYTHKKKGKSYINKIPETREALIKTGRPYVMENVPQAPLRKDIVLMGHMFGLKVLRKRIFETSFFILQPGIPPKIGSVNEGDYCQVIGKGQLKGSKGKRFKHAKENVLETWKYAMGIDWMKTNEELAESIPPLYTEYIGKQLIDYLIQTKS